MPLFERAPKRLDLPVQVKKRKIEDISADTAALASSAVQAVPSAASVSSVPDATSTRAVSPILAPFQGMSAAAPVLPGLDVAPMVVDSSSNAALEIPTTTQSSQPAAAVSSSVTTPAPASTMAEPVQQNGYSVAPMQASSLFAFAAHAIPRTPVASAAPSPERASSPIKATPNPAGSVSPAKSVARNSPAPTSISVSSAARTQVVSPPNASTASRTVLDLVADEARDGKESSSMVDSETDDEQDSQTGNRINASTVSTPVVAKAPLKPALKSGGTKTISNTGTIAVTSVRGVDKQSVPVPLQPASSLPKPSGPPPSKARA